MGLDYSFNWEEEAPLETAKAQVKHFLGQYPPDEDLWPDLVQYITIGHELGEFNGTAAQFLHASGVGKSLDLGYWEYYLGIIQKNYNLGSYEKILDVGCGYLPCLAAMIKKENPSVELTGIDPKIITKWAEEQGVIPIKDTFRYLDDTLWHTLSKACSGYDFYYGIKLCGPVPQTQLIKATSAEGKEMCLAVCDCNGLAGILGGTYEDWKNHLIDLAKSVCPRDMYVDILWDRGYNSQGHSAGNGSIERPVICTHKRRVYVIPQMPLK